MVFGAVTYEVSVEVVWKRASCGGPGARFDRLAMTKSKEPVRLRPQRPIPMFAISTLAESTSHWKDQWLGYDQFNRERPMDSFVEQLSNPFLRYPGGISQPVDAQICGRVGFPIICRNSGDR